MSLNHGVYTVGLWDLNTARAAVSRIDLESSTREGESPVSESQCRPRGIPSKAEHVKLRLNPGGPPPKAKYSSVTDSELVP